MNVLIIYCHPSHNSFTYQVKEAFIKGLKEAGHHYEVSDLYAQNFNPVISESEYLREGYYNIEASVSEDVRIEQEKINRADSIVFIYPNFWTASPAMLEGWFQRVWTYGFAYGDVPRMKQLDKAIFLMIMGGSLQDELRQTQLEAIKTIMIGDRISNRAKVCEFYPFDRMSRGYENIREGKMEAFLEKAYQIGKSL